MTTPPKKKKTTTKEPYDEVCKQCFLLVYHGTNDRVRHTVGMNFQPRWLHTCCQIWSLDRARSIVLRAGDGRRTRHPIDVVELVVLCALAARDVALHCGEGEGPGNPRTARAHKILR